MAKKTEAEASRTGTSSEREKELERRVQQLERRNSVQGVREAKLERRSSEEAELEARRLLDRYGHQHEVLGLDPSDELLGLCALGANQRASERARLEVHLHRRANGLA